MYKKQALSFPYHQCPSGTPDLPYLSSHYHKETENAIDSYTYSYWFPFCFLAIGPAVISALNCRGSFPVNLLGADIAAHICDTTF